MDAHRASPSSEIQASRLRELRGEEVATLQSVQDADSLNTRIKDLIRTHGGPIAKNQGPLNRIVELSKPVAEAMHVLPEGGTTKAVMLWGMLALVLEVRDSTQIS